MNDQLRTRAVGPPAARTVLITLLGEYVLPRGESMWQETLTSALGLMGYTSHAARRALARSITAGWLVSERHGRRSRVRLTGSMAAMLRAGAERIYGFGEPWEWDGRWLLVVLRVPEQHREVRQRVRSHLAWAGFGSLGGGLWITPHVSHEAEIQALAADGSVAGSLSFHAGMSEIGEPRGLIEQAWDLSVVDEGYRQFVARFDKLRPRTPEAVFKAQTELVDAWRRFPYIDPNLPAELLPSDWAGRRAYELFASRHARWQETADEYFRALEGLGAAPPGRVAA